MTLVISIETRLGAALAASRRIFGLNPGLCLFMATLISICSGQARAIDYDYYHSGMGYWDFKRQLQRYMTPQDFDKNYLVVSDQTSDAKDAPFALYVFCSDPKGDQKNGEMRLGFFMKRGQSRELRTLATLSAAVNTIAAAAKAGTVPIVTTLNREVFLLDWSGRVSLRFAFAPDGDSQAQSTYIIKIYEKEICPEATVRETIAGVDAIKKFDRKLIDDAFFVPAPAAPAK